MTKPPKRTAAAADAGDEDPGAAISRVAHEMANEDRQDAELFKSVAIRLADRRPVTDGEIKDALRICRKTADDLERLVRYIVRARLDSELAATVPERQRQFNAAAGAEAEVIETDRQELRALEERQKQRRLTLGTRKDDCESKLRLAIEAKQRRLADPRHAELHLRQQALRRDDAVLLQQQGRLGNQDGSILSDLDPLLRAVPSDADKDRLVNATEEILSGDAAPVDAAILQVCEQQLAGIRIDRSQPLISERTGQTLEPRGSGILNPLEFLEMVRQVQYRRDERKDLRQRRAAIAEELQQLEAQMLLPPDLSEANGI